MGRFRGGLRCIKYLLLGFNLLFWLAGSAVIGFGLWFRFGGTIKDFSSEDKSPEYFYMAECTQTLDFKKPETIVTTGHSPMCLAIPRSAPATEYIEMLCRGEGWIRVMIHRYHRLLFLFFFFPKQNCIDEIEAIISVKLQLIGIVGIGIAGLTIFGMIFSMVLCCAIRTSRDMI
nr:tetraspanin-2 [Mirounga angustirostris]